MTYFRFLPRTLVCFFAVIVWMMATLPPTSADNGAVMFVQPISGITIDGDLSDWPSDLPRQSIEVDYFGGDMPDTQDFAANFRAGYSETERCVYIALEITDEAHVVDPEGNIAWTAQDAINLYLDPTHSPRGSGAWLFTQIGSHQKLIGLENGWDPEVANASWDNVESKFVRSDNQTVYEWKIGVGEHRLAGRSMGFDLLITDQDPEDGDDGSSLYMWGQQGGKSRGAGRCGDLVFLDPNVPMGKLRGNVGWHADSFDPDDIRFPRRIRLTSKTDPQLWFQIRADEEGNYEVELPVGEYTISSAYRTIDVDTDIQKLDPAVKVDTAVRENETTLAAGLELKRLPRPDLLEAKGVLLNYDDTTASKVDQFIETYMDYYQTPGASVALINDNKVVYHRVFGVQNFYLNQPVTKDSLFEAASITKIVFAFAVNRLAERGEIDLDKPLHEYLEFEDIAHDERYKKITARHVLSHRTGFPNWAYMNADGQLDIKFHPGTKYGYSGEGFEYLKRVVCKITGKTPEEVLRDEAQVPMNFESNVYFADCEELRKVVVHGHYETKTTGSHLPDATGAAHSMHTEAGSFANFMISVMQQKGLSQASYEKMFEPQTFVEPYNDNDIQWPQYFGLGFLVVDTPHGWSFGHGGDNGDFKCMCMAIPEKGIGYVIFTNGESGYRLHESLRDFLLIGSESEEDNSITAND